MKNEASRGHLEDTQEVQFRVVAEDGDVRPRLESVAELILGDEFSGFRPPRPLTKKNLTKVLQKTLASGGVLLTCQIEHQTNQSETVAALLLRPFWSLPSAYEVVAFAHSWEAIFEGTEKEGVRSHLREEFQILANRTYKEFSAQLTNIGRSKAERRATGEAIAPALFTVLTEGRGISLEDTSLGWIGAKRVASVPLLPQTEISLTRELFFIPVTEEDNCAYENAKRSFHTQAIPLSSENLQSLERSLASHQIPVPFEFQEVRSETTLQPGDKELCLEKISDIPRGGIYWFQEDRITDGTSVVASIPNKLKRYSFILLNPSNTAERARIGLLLKEGFTVAGSLPIHSKKTYLLFSGFSPKLSVEKRTRKVENSNLLESREEKESGILSA